MLYKKKEFEYFVSKYNKDKIRLLEENEDQQYLSLEKAWLKINDNKEKTLINYIISIIKNAIISYQLSWKWEKRWLEFSNHIQKNKLFIYENTEKERKNFLENSFNNCRLKNIKLKRLNKIDKVRQYIDKKEKVLYYLNNMKKFNLLISNLMDQKENQKTIVFTTKMFWYWSRISLWKFVYFPVDINIPIDSRIKKIFSYIKPYSETKNKNINSFFEKISFKYDIPPLHLDSLLWIKYRKEIKSQL